MLTGHTKEDYAAIELARQPQVAHAMIQDDSTDYRAMATLARQRAKGPWRDTYPAWRNFALLAFAEAP